MIFQKILNKLKHFFSNYWSLVLLLIFLGVIFTRNIDFKTAIMGWDNFSVSLSLKTNFWRTLFATWREYRGFGVASDSEVTDIFRQLILFFLQLFLPNQLLDQVYYLSLFVIGVVSSYFLVKEVLTTYFKEKNTHLAQVGALVGAVFYGFNLNNVDVFYLPMVMYVVRFAFFPLITWIFFRLLKTQKIEKKTFLLFLVVTLFGSPAYLTATIFFTLLMIFGVLIFAFPKKLPRYLGLLIVFFLLNSFWLFPFLNYTVHKSGAVTESETFSLINEGLLNQYAERFALDKQLTFSSEIFSGLAFTHIEDSKPYEVHPGISYTPINGEVPVKLFLFLPVVLIGILAALWKVKENKTASLGFMALILVSLFFLTKEYSPVGFLYDLLGSYIPILKIVLRFAGTKIFILLALSFAVFIGIGVSTIIRVCQKLLPKESASVIATVISLALFAVVGWTAISAVQGSIFFSLLRVKIPDSYSQIAQTINKDPTLGRVVHLPINQFSYWKSYSWGYFGSAFFNFMVDKPLLDKTFSPASLENDYFDMKLADTIQNSSVIADSDKAQRAQQLYSLFKKSGVRYVVLDQSVSTHLTTKRMNAWGNASIVDPQAVVQKMVDLKLLDKVEEHSVNLADTAAVYGKTISDLPATLQQNPHITLYRLKESVDQVRSITQAINIDPKIEDTFNAPVLNDQIDSIQTTELSSRTYPFWQPNQKVEFGKENIQVTQNFPTKDASLHIDDSVALATQSAHQAYDVFLKMDKQKLSVLLQPTKVPFDKKFRQNDATEALSETLPKLQIEKAAFDDSMDKHASNWFILGDRPLSNYRLQVGDSILPVPYDLAKDQTEYLTTVMLTPGKNPVTLLKNDVKTSDVKPLSTLNLKLSPNPNCIPDRKDGYKVVTSYKNTVLNIDSMQGTACLQMNVVLDPEDSKKAPDLTRQHYAEFTVTAKQTVTDQDPLPAKFSPLKLQNAIRDVTYNLPDYSSMALCLRQNEKSFCLNDRQAVVTNDKAKEVVVGSEKIFTGSVFQVQVIIPANGNEKHHVSLDNLVVQTFSPVVTKQFSVSDSVASRSGQTTQLVDSSQLQLSFPYILSASSYFMNPGVDAFQQKFRGKCIQESGDHRDHNLRMSRQLPNGDVLSYTDDCYQSFFTLLPFYGDSFYLWSANYHLFEGYQPEFIAHEQYDLKNELVSRSQGYPNIPGFKDLQGADAFLMSKNQAVKKVNDAIGKTNIVTAHSILPAQGTISNPGQEFFEFYQAVGNQGLIELNNVRAMALPQDWQAAYVENGQSEHHFDQLKINSVQRVLPSLWKLEVSLPEKIEQGKYLLQFGQGYDPQWEIYQGSSIVSVFLGQGKVTANHLRVNGWSNGWIVSADKLPKSGKVTLYFFYTPERWALLGWGITGVTVIVAVLGLVLGSLFGRRRQTKAKPQIFGGKIRRAFVK
jgi:hypothetical protein